MSAVGGSPGSDPGSRARDATADLDAHGASYADPRTRQVPNGAALRNRQAEGLAALLAVAAQSSLAMSEAASSSLISIAVPPALGGLRSGQDVPTHQVGPEAPPSRAGAPLAGALARLRSDHMVRNSLYLIVSSGLQGGLGFVFWVVMARLFSTEDVGRASSLVSATAVIAYLALLGLNSTMVRYLPTAEDPNALITASFLLVVACGGALGLVYVAATPIIAPRLAFIAHSPALAAGFAMMAAGAAVNLVTDSIFIASRRAGLCALTDGGVGGTIKIASGVLLAGTGAYGVFAASTGGFASSAVASVVIIAIVLKWRPALINPFRTLRPLFRFSAASYVANILNLLPVLVVPLIVLDRLGPRSAAYYFVSFQIATLLYSGAYAVGQSLMAEGSQAGADRRMLYRRSRRVLITCYLPAILVLAGVSHWILLVFGTRYSQNGTATLMLLCVAAIPIAICNWTWTVLRLSGRLGGIIVSSAVYTIAICATAWLLAAYGLAGLTAGWPIGALLAAAAAAVALRTRSRAAARHRRRGRTPDPDYANRSARGHAPYTRPDATS